MRSSPSPQSGGLHRVGVSRPLPRVWDARSGMLQLQGRVARVLGLNLRLCIGQVRSG